MQIQIYIAKLATSTSSNYYG